MEPRTAGAVHRVGEDHQCPRQPLGDVGAAGHGHTGAGFDGDPPGAADRVAQADEDLRIDVGQPRRVVQVEGGDGFGEPVGVGDPARQDCRVGPVGEQLGHQVGEHRVVRSGPRCDVSCCQPCRFGVPRVDHPHLAAARDVADGAGRVGHRQGMTVRDHRVAADAQQELDACVVGPAAESHEAAHQVGHQWLGRAVDGQRAELRRGADRRVQCLGHPVAGRVHADPRAEEDRHRPRPVLADDRFQPSGQIVQDGVPGAVLQNLVGADLRVLEAVRAVVQFGQRPALRAGVAGRHRMVAVAAYPDHPLALDVDQDAAHRLADPAEASDRPYLRLRHIGNRSAIRRRSAERLRRIPRGRRRRVWCSRGRCAPRRCERIPKAVRRSDDWSTPY